MARTPAGSATLESPVLSIDRSELQLSQGSGAFRVRLVGRDFSSVREFVVAGSTPVVADLTAGTYRAFVERIEVQPQPLGAFDIAVSDVPTSISLPPDVSAGPLPLNVVPVRRSLEDRGGGPSLSPPTAAATGDYAVIERFAATSLETSYGRRRTDSGVSFSEDDVAFSAGEPAPSAASKRFAVGVSTTIGVGGGWVPSDVRGILVRAGTDGALTINFAPHLTGPWHRIRLTLAVEGLPAVRIPVPLFLDGVNVKLLPQPTIYDFDVQVRISPARPAVSAVVGALDRLSDEDAEAVLKWANIDGAIDMLAQSFEDPWSAVAAALLLVKTGQAREYASWIYTLSQLTPAVSDSAVAAAWARASDTTSDLAQSEQDTLSHLLAAAGRGAPTFLISNSLANEVLQSLAISAHSSDVRQQAESIWKSDWLARARNRLRSHVFLIWEEFDSELETGALPATGYRELASGSVSAMGFELDILAVAEAEAVLAVEKQMPSSTSKS